MKSAEPAETASVCLPEREANVHATRRIIRLKKSGQAEANAVETHGKVTSELLVESMVQSGFLQVLNPSNA